MKSAFMEIAYDVTSFKSKQRAISKRQQTCRQIIDAYFNVVYTSMLHYIRTKLQIVCSGFITTHDGCAWTNKH